MGGHIALLAILLAGAVARPAAYKLGALTRTVGGQASPPTAEQNAERTRLIRRATLVTLVTLVTQVTAVLLVVTIALMAIGRYV